MNITIKVIPPSEMRPEVDGADWTWDANGDLQVRVCPMSDWRFETLLAIHEAVEAIMCKHNGVTQKSVDDFDVAYDLAHPTEPDLNAGDDPAAPYKREHCFATAIERILCGELNVDWKTYDDELGTTYPGPSKKPAVEKSETGICDKCGAVGPLTVISPRGTKYCCNFCAFGGGTLYPLGCRCKFGEFGIENKAVLV